MDRRGQFQVLICLQLCPRVQLSTHILSNAHVCVYIISHICIRIVINLMIRSSRHKCKNTKHTSYLFFCVFCLRAFDCVQLQHHSRVDRALVCSVHLCVYVCGYADVRVCLRWSRKRGTHRRTQGCRREHKVKERVRREGCIQARDLRMDRQIATRNTQTFIDPSADHAMSSSLGGVQ